MTVKLESIKADIEAEERGDWQDYPDWPGVAFRVRSLHYQPYQTERDLLLQRLARKHKGKTPPRAELAQEAGKLYCKHILFGWRGFDIEYTPEKALEVMTDIAYRRIIDAVEWCAERVAQTDVEFIEETAKNSAAPSPAV